MTLSWKVIKMTNLDELDVTDNMQNNIKIIQNVLSNLGINIQEPGQINNNKKQEIENIIDKLDQKIDEIEDYFWRPLDSPEVYQQLKNLAVAIGKDNKADKFELTLLPIMVLTICFLIYLFYVASGFTTASLQQNIAAIFESDRGLNVALQTPPEYYLGNISDSLVLFLSLLGIGTAVKQYSLGVKRSSFIAIGIPSLAFLFFYFTNLSGLIPRSNDILLYRLPILVSPFIIILAAYGLNYFIQFGWNTVKRKLTVYPAILSAVLVIMITFFSMMTSANSNDVNYVQRSTDTGSTYFTESELTAFSFITTPLGIKTIPNNNNP